MSDVTGPVWAIILFMLGGFVPSLVAFFLTWQREGVSGLKQFGRRGLQFKIGGRWYLTMVALVVLATLGQILIIRISWDIHLTLIYFLCKPVPFFRSSLSDPYLRNSAGGVMHWTGCRLAGVP